MITLNAGGMTLATPTAPSSARTSACHNLRPVTTSTGSLLLMPVGQPSVISGHSWRPVAFLYPDDAPVMLIIVDGADIAVIEADPLDSPDEIVAGIDDINPVTLPAKITTVVSSGSELIAMTEDGPQILRFDAASGRLIFDADNAFPALSLMVDELSDCSSVIPPRTLSLEYPAFINALFPSDLRAVTSDILQAYTSIAAQADAIGAFCAPVLCRYRIIGDNGNILFTSAPVLLSATSTDITRPILLKSSDRRELPAYTLAARAWKVKLCASEPFSAAAARRISRIEILASPQLHPLSFDDLAEATVVMGAANTDFLRLTIPGAGHAVAPGNPAAGASRLRQTVAALPDIERVVAVINPPFNDSEPVDSTPDIFGSLVSVRNECKTASISAPASLSSSASHLAAVSSPHSFSAACSAMAAGKILWGALTPIRYNGYPIETFAATRAADGPWHATVSVTFASGDEQVVAVSQGAAGAPLTLNPLLSYPAPDAVTMTIALSHAGEVRRLTVPLVTDPAGRCALYIHSSLSPFSIPLSDAPFIVPAAKKRIRPLSSFVAAADSGSPLAPCAVAPVSEGALIAIAPACRSQSSWDYKNPRFSAFTASGVYTVTLSSAGEPRPTLVSPFSIIQSPDAFTDADGRLIAATSDRLVEVGISRVKTLISGFRATALAFNPATRELWATDRDAHTTVIDIDTLRAYTRDEALTSRGVATFASVDGKLADISAERPQQSVFIRWDADFDISTDYTRINALCLDARSPALSSATLTLTRYAHRDAEPYPAAQFTINGKINAPYKPKLITLPARRATLSFQARADPATTIASLNLITTQKRPLTWGISIKNTKTKP